MSGLAIDQGIEKVAGGSGILNLGAYMGYYIQKRNIAPSGELILLTFIREIFTDFKPRLDYE